VAGTATEEEEGAGATVAAPGVDRRCCAVACHMQKKWRVGEGSVGREARSRAGAVSAWARKDEPMCSACFLFNAVAIAPCWRSCLFPPMRAINAAGNESDAADEEGRELPA